MNDTPQSTKQNNDLELELLASQLREWRANKFKRGGTIPHVLRKEVIRVLDCNPGTYKTVVNQLGISGRQIKKWRKAIMQDACEQAPQDADPAQLQNKFKPVTSPFIAATLDTSPTPVNCAPIRIHLMLSTGTSIQIDCADVSIAGTLLRQASECKCCS